MQFLIAFTCGLICLLAVSAAPPTPEEQEQMKESVEKCAKESGVDPEVLKNVKSDEVRDDGNLHCFGACMMKDMGIMNEAGVIQPDKAIARIPDHLPKDDVIKMIELCAKEKDDNPCVTAALVFKCLRDNGAGPLLHIPHHQLQV